MSEVRTVERHGQTHAVDGEDPIGGSDLGIGEVKMWYGALADLPPNWQVCDGTNGTPDMQGRSPVGVGDNGTNTYALGDAAGGDTVTGSLTHANGAVANHPHHVHGASLSQGAAAGSAFNAWDAAANSANESPTLEHAVTQPDPHSLSIDVRSYLRALYFVMRIA